MKEFYENNIAAQRLGIYIHIPFCVKKCHYCDFLSAPTDDETMHKYVDAIIREIELSKEMMKGYTIDTIFFGGGTPSILAANEIKRITEALKASCNINDKYEMTIECNPGTLSEEKLLIYKTVGVNRLSIGLQSADNEELKSIGRIHTWEQFVKNFELARELGFDNINIDLMSSLPRQKVDTYKSTLKKVIELQPEHISAYSLIVEEGTPLCEMVEKAKSEGISILPNEDEEREMYFITEKMLFLNGYSHYEISNYSLNGYECKHNVGYWKRKDYMGFGIGSASLYKGIRYSNTNDLQKYLTMNDIEEIRTNKEILKNKDKMEEFMFLGLRMIEGINRAEFKRQFNVKIETVYGDVLNEFIDKQLLIEENDNIKLTERGIDVSNTVLAEFLIDE